MWRVLWRWKRWWLLWRVGASTGKPASLKSSALVIFDIRTDILPPAPLPSVSAGAGGLAAWGQALIIALIFIILILVAGAFILRKFSVNNFLLKRGVDLSGGAGGQQQGGGLAVLL